MRFDLCIKLFKFFFPDNPGEEEEAEVEGMAVQPSQASSFRQCLNIKSRSNPDVQCSLAATHGEFCSRHFKKPRRYIRPSIRVYTRSEHIAARKLQNFWRKRYALLRFCAQGPASNLPSLATNETELYTLDPITAITPLYFFSFADEKKNIWAFDIRSFCHVMLGGKPPSNPYTRDLLTSMTLQKIRTRISWLRRRKYPTLHIQMDQLSAEQYWNQKVLDVFMKIEGLGYLVSCDWFHSLKVEDHHKFYGHLFHLWYVGLGLTPDQKKKIVPGHQGRETALFKFPPTENRHREQHWWAKINLSLIESFITRSEDPENRKLGALYVLTALVDVSEDAADAFPWLLQETEEPERLGPI
jgi:hypothetical protein